MHIDFGNPDEYSVREFVTYIKDMTNSKSEMDDPSQRKPVIQVADKKLGCKRKVRVEDGLKS